MLIMWRRAGQSFTVGDGVEIEILDARPNRVKLGIVAAPAIPIVRGESRITREENLAAALSAGEEMILTLLRGLPVSGPALATDPDPPVNKLTTPKVRAPDSRKSTRTSC